MTPETWIALSGVAAQVLIGAFFFGATFQKIKGLSKDNERIEASITTLTTRTNDHTERIARLEGRV